MRPISAVAKQHEQDLLWICDDFLFCEDDFTKFIVHGHTPSISRTFVRTEVNIDTGAYATGRLTCLILVDDVMQIL